MRSAVVEMQGGRTTFFPSRPRRAMLIGTACLLAFCFGGTTGSAAGKAQAAINPHLAKAVELMDRGNLEAAEKEARLAISDPAARPLAYSTLGAIRLQQKRFRESEEFLAQAIRLNPRLLGAHLNLGGVYALEGKMEESGKAYRQALELDPNNHSARIGLAKVESALGRYAASLDVSRPILNELRRSPEGLLLLMTNYVGLGDRASAAPLATDWKSLPEVPQEARVEFAALLIKGELFSEAIELLEDAKKRSGASYPVAVNLAGCYFMKQDWARATANYQLALTFDENCILCYQQIARAAQLQGDRDQALSYLIMAKRRHPDNPDVLLDFGRLCLEKDLIDDALKALERAVEIRPDHEPSLYVLASAHVAKRQYPEARDLLEGLVKKRPTDAQLNYALGTVLYLDVKLAEASEYLRKSLALQPDQMASYYYLGLVEERKGQDEEAVRVFRELLLRYPSHAHGYEALGTVLLKQKKYEEAQAALKKAIDLDPNSSKARYQLGMVFARLGNKSASDREFQLVKELQAKEREKPVSFELITPH